METQTHKPYITVRVKWGDQKQEHIRYKRNYKALSLGAISIIAPLDFGLFAYLGIKLNHPVHLRYRLRQRFKELKQTWSIRRW